MVAKKNKAEKIQTVVTLLQHIYSFGGGIVVVI